MKKSFFAALVLIILIIIFPLFVLGEETALDRQIDTSGIPQLNELTKSAREFDEDFDFESRVREEISGQRREGEWKNILENCVNLFFGSLKSTVADIGKIMITVIIFGIILRLIPEGTTCEIAFYCTYAVIFSICLLSFTQAAQVGKDAVAQLNFFVKGAVPVMCSLGVPSGQIISSTQIAAIIGGICVVTEGAERILMPFTCLMASLAAANNLSDEISFKGLEQTIKKVIMWFIGIVMTVFVSLLKVRGITGATIDSAGGKLVKFAVGNMIPFVGGIISDSLENIISYSKAIKAGCGAVGIIAVIYMVLPPVMKIFGMLIAFRLSEMITSPVADRRISGAISNFSDILGLVLIIVVTISILFIIAIGSLAI
ncbi:MAG: stage III sporulation protein AE [Clostridia bacterium]|nr:stage III sporulation protein AE [Clostridia bacterium]